MKTNSKGFTLVLLLFIISALIVAGIGFLIYQSKNSESKPNNKEETTTPPITQVTSSPEDNSKCALVPETGPCKAKIVSFYFDQSKGECSEFVWGGCQGVRPFETLEECQRTCGTSQTETPVKAEPKDGCVISGCSSEICSEEEMFSTCVLKPENECYKSATCRKQENGKCGWTQTDELSVCLNSY